MKSSKSHARWAPAPKRRVPGRGKPAEAQLPLLCPHVSDALAHSIKSWQASWRFPPPLLYVFMLTVSLCVVYVTLNCNSLNRRPNCFLYGYVQTFMLMPCISP